MNRMRIDGDEKDGDDRDVVDAGRHRVLHQIQKSCRSRSLSLMPPDDVSLLTPDH